GEGKEHRRETEIRIVEQQGAVFADAGLRETDLQDVADGRIEQVDDRHLETALRVDGEGGRIHAPAHRPLVERPLRNLEQYGGPERQRVRQLLAQERPVDLRTAAAEEEPALQPEPHRTVQDVSPEEPVQPK